MRISKLLDISHEAKPNIKCLITDHSGVIAIVEKLIFNFFFKLKMSILFDFSGLYNQQRLKYISER